MKVVHVVFSFCTGGIETMLVDIMRLQANEAEVHLIIVNDLYDSALLSAIDPRVHIHRLGRHPGSRNPLPIFRLNALTARLRPDVVHIHQGSLAKWLRVGPRPVLTVHALAIDLHPRARACRLAAISDAVAADIRTRYGAATDVAVIPNGIDTEAIAPRPGGPLGSPVRLVQVARFDFPQKGQDILIQALGKLKSMGYDVDLTLIGGADYDQIPALEEMARKAGVADSVRFLRGLTRPEVYAALAGFDIMVHPARYEGFGLVIAEGMAAGLPVVIPDSGGPFEVADQGRLAETFPSGDPDACAAAIARVINAYPEALARAEQGRAHVAARYSLARMVAQYKEFYKVAESN